MSYTNRMTFGQAVASGLYSRVIPWTKVGYVAPGGAGTFDIWSYGATVATVPLMGAAATVKVQSNNAADTGTAIHSGNTTGGSTTTLGDTGANFLGGTPVAVGDCVILDKAGVVPEWGYVTAVAAQMLTVAGGFSSGGTCGGAARAYEVVDYSATAGAHAVLVNGLDAAFATTREIVLPGGAGPAYVTTTKTYLRFNSFRVIATGSAGVPSGNLAIMDNGAIPATTYTFITAGFTRARNISFCVPSGRTLWIEEWNAGFVAAAANKYARLITRAGQYAFDSGATPFLTRETLGVNLWYPYSEIAQSAGTASIMFPEPTRLVGTADLKVSAVVDGAGVATSVLRGYLTTP